jgi:hypothetical protein
MIAPSPTCHHDQRLAGRRLPQDHGVLHVEYLAHEVERQIKDALEPNAR